MQLLSLSALEPRARLWSFRINPEGSRNITRSFGCLSKAQAVLGGVCVVITPVRCSVDSGSWEENLGWVSCHFLY